MRGINKVILIGNLGQDPEVKYLNNGNAVTNLSLATSETWKDKNTGQKQDKTEWHRIVMFNKLAEIAGEYLKKGAKIYVEGKLQTRKWKDQQGADHYTTEVIANEMQMLNVNQTQKEHSHDKSSGWNQESNQQSMLSPRESDLNDDVPF